MERDPLLSRRHIMVSPLLPHALSFLSNLPTATYHVSKPNIVHKEKRPPLLFLFACTYTRETRGAPCLFHAPQPSSSSSSSSASALILEMDMCPLQSSFPFCFPWILLLFPFPPFLAEEGLSLRAEQVQYSPNTTFSFLKEKKTNYISFTGKQ